MPVLPAAAAAATTTAAAGAAAATAVPNSPLFVYLCGRPTDPDCSEGCYHSVYHEYHEMTQELFMCVCMCACACVHVCACACKCAMCAWQVQRTFSTSKSSNFSMAGYPNGNVTAQHHDPGAGNLISALHRVCSVLQVTARSSCHSLPSSSLSE